MSSLDSPARPASALDMGFQTERLAATALFVITFLYTWISLSPFPDLTFANREAASSAASNMVNRVVVVGLVATLVSYALTARVGIDATFTRRTEIWQIALDHIGKRPWTGYGYQSFWRSADLMYGHREELNWAVNAADGHNGYLDLLLTAGIPGFALALAFLLVLPAFYVGRAEKHGAERRLTELFNRIWVFGMLVACLESTLLATTGALWFSILMAVFGLRLQAKARLRGGA